MSTAQQTKPRSAHLSPTPPHKRARSPVAQSTRRKLSPLLPQPGAPRTALDRTVSFDHNSHTTTTTMITPTTTTSFSIAPQQQQHPAISSQHSFPPPMTAASSFTSTLPPSLRAESSFSSAIPSLSAESSFTSTIPSLSTSHSFASGFTAPYPPPYPAASPPTYTPLPATVISTASPAILADSLTQAQALISHLQTLTSHQRLLQHFLQLDLAELRARLKVEEDIAGAQVRVLRGRAQTGSPGRGTAERSLKNLRDARDARLRISRGTRRVPGEPGAATNTGEPGEPGGHRGVRVSRGDPLETSHLKQKLKKAMAENRELRRVLSHPHPGPSLQNHNHNPTVSLVSDLSVPLVPASLVPLRPLSPLVHTPPASRNTGGMTSSSVMSSGARAARERQHIMSAAIAGYVVDQNMRIKERDSTIELDEVDEGDEGDEGGEGKRDRDRESTPTPGKRGAGPGRKAKAKTNVKERGKGRERKEFKEKEKEKERQRVIGTPVSPR